MNLLLNLKRLFETRNLTTREKLDREAIRTDSVAGLVGKEKDKSLHRAMFAHSRRAQLASDPKETHFMVSTRTSDDQNLPDTEFKVFPSVPEKRAKAAAHDAKTAVHYSNLIKKGIRAKHIKDIKTYGNEVKPANFGLEPEIEKEITRTKDWKPSHWTQVAKKQPKYNKQTMKLSGLTPKEAHGMIQFRIPPKKMTEAKKIDVSNIDPSSLTSFLAKVVLDKKAEQSQEKEQKRSSLAIKKANEPVIDRPKIKVPGPPTKFWDASKEPKHSTDPEQQTIIDPDPKKAKEHDIASTQKRIKHSELVKASAKEKFASGPFGNIDLNTLRKKQDTLRRHYTQQASFDSPEAMDKILHRIAKKQVEKSLKPKKEDKK